MLGDASSGRDGLEDPMVGWPGAPATAPAGRVLLVHWDPFQNRSVDVSRKSGYHPADLPVVSSDSPAPTHLFY